MVYLKEYRIASVLFAFSLYYINVAHAQFPDRVQGTRETKALAKELTRVYDAWLGLDGIQLPIFEEIVEDYIILSNKAKQQLEGKEELDALTELMINETLQMENLLTLFQFREYIRVRQEIQPIKKLEPN
ncbi:hypothetical protein [Cognatitamlana onchidii]|uniref:hypothetical protein n=1 Tax=Cognatitamlana onchidii TaxID=2562860 RepID=UPI0010A5B992|nr:hypothetical protein [Algibacter onchidii]